MRAFSKGKLDSLVDFSDGKVNDSTSNGNQPTSPVWTLVVEDIFLKHWGVKSEEESGYSKQHSKMQPLRLEETASPERASHLTTDITVEHKQDGNIGKSRS